MQAGLAAVQSQRVAQGALGLLGQADLVVGFGESGVVPDVVWLQGNGAAEGRGCAEQLGAVGSVEKQFSQQQMCSWFVRKGRGSDDRGLHSPR